MTEQRFERVIRYITEQPWMIEPEALGVIIEIVDYRLNHGKRSAGDLDDLLPDEDPPEEERRGKTAIIPLYGTIIPKATAFSSISGATSLEMFAAALDAADRDADISTIVIDIDSPGGSVELVPETAEKIRGLETHTIAVANTRAASAAYYLASQADEVVVTPSGEVGSIGVWTAHQDISAHQRQVGVNTTLISAGKYKVEGNPFGPLDKTARDAMQAKVDHYYDMFVADVALGRGVSAQAVRNGYGEGRMVTAPDALAEGIVDRIATLEQVVSERTNGAQPVAVAASARVVAYFDDPAFGVPGTDKRLKYDPDAAKWSTPPTIDGDHFYGHVAPMGLCLRGRADRCVTPPEGDVEGFMRGYAPAAGGRRTGVVTLTDRSEHGHSSVGVGAVEATKWYDSVGRGVADVRVGRDAYGIWFSGMIRPGTSKEDRYALAASDVSGHWELGQRGLPMLCGLPAVSVGGYPKGYLSAEEVASGIAAAGEFKTGGVIKTPKEHTVGASGFEMFAPGVARGYIDDSAYQELVAREDAPKMPEVIADLVRHLQTDADCGCQNDGIDLKTVLAFHGK